MHIFWYNTVQWRLLFQQPNYDILAILQAWKHVINIGTTTVHFSSNMHSIGNQYLPFGWRDFWNQSLLWSGIFSIAHFTVGKFSLKWLSWLISTHIHSKPYVRTHWLFVTVIISLWWTVAGHVAKLTVTEHVNRLFFSTRDDRCLVGRLVTHRRVHQEGHPA